MWLSDRTWLKALRLDVAKESGESTTLEKISTERLLWYIKIHMDSEDKQVEQEALRQASNRRTSEVMAALDLTDFVAPAMQQSKKPTINPHKPPEGYSKFRKGGNRQSSKTKEETTYHRGAKQAARKQVSVRTGAKKSA